MRLDRRGLTHICSFYYWNDLKTKVLIERAEGDYDTLISLNALIHGEVLVIYNVEVSESSTVIYTPSFTKNRIVVNLGMLLDALEIETDVRYAPSELLVLLSHFSKLQHMEIGNKFRTMFNNSYRVTTGVYPKLQRRG